MFCHQGRQGEASNARVHTFSTLSHIPSWSHLLEATSWPPSFANLPCLWGADEVLSDCV